MMLIHRNGRKEDLGNYSSGILTSIAREGYGADHLECNHVWHVQDNQVDQAQPAWVCRRQSCLSNLISYDKVTHIVDEGNAVDVLCLDFSKAFDTVSHSILLEKHVLDGCAVCGVKNCLVGQAQRVVVNGLDLMIVKVFSNLNNFYDSMIYYSFMECVLFKNH